MRRTAVTPPEKEPCPVTARPTWCAITSAPSLSLFWRTRSTMSASGRLVTCASSGAPGAAFLWCTAPVTRTPSPRRYDAKSAAAVAAGSATRLRPPGATPSSAQSAVIGETTPSTT